MNVLFVCSLGRFRSRTCADYYVQWVNTRYGGVYEDAYKCITEDDLEWADKIICMEKFHRYKLRRKYKGQSHKMYVWNIPDNYYYNDPLLLTILSDKIKYLFK